MSQGLNLKILLVSRLHTLLLIPTNCICSDWGERGRKIIKQNKQTQMLQQRLGANYLIYHYQGDMYIFLCSFFSFFFFCEVKSKLLLALKKKSQPSERWQRHRCHQDIDKTMHKHWLQCHTGDLVHEKPLHLTWITELYFRATRKAG